jgi:4-hydroxyacetophenone monooxygenase
MRVLAWERSWALAHIPFYLRWYRFQLFWGFADGLHAALMVDPDWPHPQRALNALNEKHRRFMVRHMREELADRPDLLEKVVPDYPAYGKRILIDNRWFKMLKRDNVDLITDAIAGIEPHGVRTRDGKLWEADALVLATGFKVSQMLGPMKILADMTENCMRSGARMTPGPISASPCPAFPTSSS